MLAPSRAKHRAIGVTAGVAAGAGLACVLPANQLLDLTIAIVRIFCMVAFQNYALAVAVRTLPIVIGALAFDQESMAMGIAAGLVRLENIYIGVIIALAGTTLFWATLARTESKGSSSQNVA